MISIVAKAGIAALITLGAAAAANSTASATEFGAGVQQVRYDAYHGSICSPVLAVQKARAMGLRRAAIADITRRRVVVSGFGRHGRDRIVFANARGCPPIRR
jgi:hypothetical protein